MSTGPLTKIIEGVFRDDPNGPEPEFVLRAFMAAIDQRPDNPEKFPLPTASDWAWFGRYAARTGQSWLIDSIKP